MFKYAGCSRIKKKRFHVFLTRSRDISLSLDDRSTYANKKNADLFLSIHANYGSSTTSAGIETFWFSPDLLKTRGGTLNDQEFQKAHLYLQENKKSYLFADLVQRHVMNAVQVYNIPNRFIKTGGVQVLLGTEMPACLIEVGFLSNEREARLLADASYQQLLVQGIVKGIEAYLKGQRDILQKDK